MAVNEETRFCLLLKRKTCLLLRQKKMSSVETEDMSELFKWLFARRPAAGGINLMFAVRSRLRGADYL